ncbi:MAG TPA: ABC transporter permease subunit [Bacteroidales bacterium]|nr:ABC transporter permease subunit [Bacteroidales bacterium]
MNNTIIHNNTIFQSLKIRIKSVPEHLSSTERTGIDTQTSSPFLTIVHKEVADHIKSWRFIILVAIIALTCFGSVYTAVTSMGKAVKQADPETAFFFLKLFTVSDGSIPAFFTFIGFLGPLLGIALGFDAVNSEQNKGTLSRILAQPIPRDYIINAKFVAALVVISIMLFALGFLVMGFGLIFVGIPPTAGEFMRIIFFLTLSIIYVAFWLNLSIFFSIKFRQPATSALSGIAVWLFFTIFYALIINMATRSMTPPQFAPDYVMIRFENFKLALMRFAPNQLFSEATTTLLMPNIRSLGPLTVEQIEGAIPGPLPLSQSVLLVWPQLTGLIAASILCFVLSFRSFMRREIRSR